MVMENFISGFLGKRTGNGELPHSRWAVEYDEFHSQNIIYEESG